MVCRRGGHVTVRLAGRCDRNVLDFRMELDRCFARILPEVAEEAE